MSGKRLLKIRLSLKGRPIKTFTFNKEVITVGRNPEADIFLDNPGVSRDHLKLEMTSRGFYAVEDLGSANGTFLNDQPIKREYLMNNDVVRVSKFSLWVNYEEDRRSLSSSGRTNPHAFEGTTVLSTDELEEMMHHEQQQGSVEPEPVVLEAHPVLPSGTRWTPSWPFLLVVVVLMYLLGTLLAPRMPWSRFF
ncbi:MAG TPA: FHA domain-containing protein [Candidatus Eisenbacteria bacterium]|nr:FHA domain-containing protein [Candidatus Eisenbacteria bacterium]